MSEAADLPQTQSAYRYHQIFEHAPIPCLVVSADGTLQEHNRAARQVLGPDIGGGPVADHIDEPHRERFLELLEGCRAGWSDVTVSVPCASGPRRMKIDCGPIDDDTLLLLLHDVTELHGAHERLETIAEHNRKLVSQLREVDGIRQLLLLTVSHDLRTPLAAIAGLAGLLDTHGELSDDDRHRIVERIHHNAVWVVDQFAHVLDVQRLESGRDTLRREPTEISGLVNACLDRVELADRLVVTELPPATAWVDRVFIERMADNLLRNSIRHTPAGTTIWVRVCRHGDRIVIIVEDNGPGVPGELVPQLFQLFQRNRDPDAVDGLGVGLWLVRRFAELHGGTAWYEGRAGGGASFHVELPDPA